MNTRQHTYVRDDALASLASHDQGHPPSAVAGILADARNARLLEYVHQEAFTHVYPGDTPLYSVPSFLTDLDAELRAAPAFHLWAEIPLCKYRCHFCQFPILVLSGHPDAAESTARRWVDANIAEARLWLEAVPSLAETPVGEFCLFGGTPTAIPPRELERLFAFYAANFRFTAETSLRAEGSPDTITPDALRSLADMGFRTLTYGIQSFDDDLLRLANRRHTGADAVRAIELARDLGFDRVDGDLVWGLPGQDVDGFLADVQRMVDLDFSTIVIIKLHLRSFVEAGTAIGHITRAAWEDPAVRDRLAAAGHAWPSLGTQFQMREAAQRLLAGAGYYEHPTTYFPKRSVGPEKWRSMNLDQDKQYPEVGIGLGGYTWSSRSEAHAETDPAAYLKRVDAGELPLTDITGTAAAGREARSLRMALSTCQPLSDAVHRARFPGSSLFGDRWGPLWDDLATRGLAEADRTAGTVTLTAAGRTLVESIMNMEIR